MADNSNITHKIVLWSGGFDSTALLLGLVEKYKDDSNIDIQCVSIECNACGGTKVKREIEARKKILKYISNKYDVEINNPTIKIDYDNFNGQNNGLAQPLIWLFSSLPLIPDNSTIYPGYINGDDALACTEDLFSIVKDISHLQLKTISLDLSTRYVRKDEILTYLIKNHPDLLDICTSCENPGREDKCNLCAPCLHTKETLFKMMMSPNKEVAKVAYDKLKEWFGIDICSYIQDEVLNYEEPKEVPDSELISNIVEVK